MKKKSSYKILSSPLFIVLFLFTIFVLISFNRVMNNDEGMWSYIGRIWSDNGIAPYLGAVDNKTPGIFEIYAISNLLFGVNVFFVRWLGVALLLLSSFIIYLIAKKLHSRLAGVISMYIFGLSMTWELMDGAYSSQTESFMVFFSVLAFYFVIKAKEKQNGFFWIILAGISMGFAIAFKQIAVTTMVALLFFYLVFSAKNKAKKSVLFGVIFLVFGVVISTIISVIPLLLSGVSFNDYFDGAWLILSNSASSAPSVVRLNGFIHLWLNSRIVIFYPLLFLIFIQRDLIKKKYFLGLIFWLVLDFIGVNASGYYYGHQVKQLMPALALIVGILLSNRILEVQKIKSMIHKQATILIATIIILGLPYQDILINGYIITAYSDNNKEIGLWVKNHTENGDYVYLSGSYGSPILAYSKRKSPSKYFHPIFATNKKTQNQLLTDLMLNPPKYFLKHQIDKNIGEEIEAFVSHNYSYQFSKDSYDFYLFDPKKITINGRF
ncbi:MAG: glycosyltransferase family 39 protein [Bacteroidota bacterium]